MLGRENDMESHLTSNQVDVKGEKGTFADRELSILDFSSAEKFRANLQRLEQEAKYEVTTSHSAAKHGCTSKEHTNPHSPALNDHMKVSPLGRTLEETPQQHHNVPIPCIHPKGKNDIFARLYDAKRHQFPILHTLLTSRGAHPYNNPNFHNKSCGEVPRQSRALESLSGCMRHYAIEYQPLDGNNGDHSERKQKRSTALQKHSDHARRRDMAQLNDIFTRNGDRYFSVKNSSDQSTTPTPYTHTSTNNNTHSNTNNNNGIASPPTAPGTTNNTSSTNSGGERHKGKSKPPSCGGVDVNDQADRACIGFWSQTPKLRERGLPGKCRGLSIVQVAITEPEMPPGLAVKTDNSEDLYTDTQPLAMHMTDAEKERAVQQGHLQEVSDELCAGFWKQTRMMRMEGLPGECIGVSIVEVETEKDYYNTNYCPVIGVSILRMDAPEELQRPEPTPEREVMTSPPQPLHERLQSLAKRAGSLAMLMGESTAEFVKEKCTKEAAKNVLETEYNLLKATAENVRTLKVVTIAQEHVPGNCLVVIKLIKKWWRGGENEED